MSANDLGCVKTQKFEKRRELFSQIKQKRTRSDSCGYNCNSEERSFYRCRAPLRFYTAKTQSGHRLGSRPAPSREPARVGMMHGTLTWRSDEMRDLRSTFDVISVNRALQDTVGIGHTLVLTQMLKPRFNEECFQKLSFFGCIFEDTPCISAVTTPLMS